MTTTHDADIIYDVLCPAARHAHVVPGLFRDSSLLSIGTLCDTDYTVTFNAEFMKLHDKDKRILIGHRNTRNGLWHVDLAGPRIQRANII
jgi:hypothetical protein